MKTDLRKQAGKQASKQAGELGQPAQRIWYLSSEWLERRDEPAKKTTRKNNKAQKHACEQAGKQTLQPDTKAAGRQAITHADSRKQTTSKPENMNEAQKTFKQAGR